MATLPSVRSLSLAFAPVGTRGWDVSMVVLVVVVVSIAVIAVMIRSSSEVDSRAMTCVGIGMLLIKPALFWDALRAHCLGKGPV